MTFLSTMIERGFVHQTSFEHDVFEARFKDEKIKAYIGFDLTAPALHVGSLIQLMALRHLKEHGHEIVVLIGEATTRIGDPSGKDSARQMLSPETIEANRIGITRCIDRVVGATSSMPSNSEWFDDSGPSFMSFLTEFGPHFTINRMMTFDSVRTRLNRAQPLTLLEFSYMLLQAVDFLELKRRKGVNMQIGGSDQWGNMINGLEIIRRKDGDEVFAMTTPLLLDSSGNKMGKSQGKPIWLDAEMTPVFDFYQFWRNVDDADVARFMKLFTDLDLEDIELMTQAGDINIAKRLLASSVTTLVHGVDAANDAHEKALAIFERGELIATKTVELGDDTSIVSLLVKAEMAASKSAARRLLSQNAISVDGVKVHDDVPVTKGSIIRAGKQAPVEIV